MTFAERPGRADDILNAFTRLVADRGYDAANFSDIAHELGISKGTIVHHYGTKERLLAALHEAYMRQRIFEARAIVSRLERPTEQLAALLMAFILYQTVDRDATVAFQREIVRLAEGGEAMAEGRRLRAEYLDIVEAVLRRGRHAGELSVEDEHVQALLIFGSAHWAWTWFHRERPFDPEAVAVQFVRMVLDGLRTADNDTGALIGSWSEVRNAVRQCLPSGSSAEPQG